MAFVVPRAGGRWEIRESVHTESGPRARTLVTFRVWTDDVLVRAAEAATRPFDAEAVRAAARRAGVPSVENDADRAARVVISETEAGRPPSPGLRRLLLDELNRLGSPPVLEAGDSTAEWVRVSDQTRGETLRDLLELADRLPARRRGALRFPPLRGAHEG